MLHAIEVLANARRSLRRAVQLEVEVIATGWDTPRIHRATDLSLDGMRVAAGTRLPEDDHVVVCFTPPGAWGLGEVQSFARVVRSEARRGERSASMGLELLDIDYRQKRGLAQILRGLPPPIPRASRPRELVWIDMLVTYTEDLGDRLNTFEVSEALRAIDEGEIAPAALSELLTGSASRYVWKHAA
jgi:hypothetical protein